MRRKSLVENLTDTGAGIIDYFKSLGTTNIFDLMKNSPVQKIVIKNKDGEKQTIETNNSELSNKLGLKGEKEVKALVRSVNFELNQRKALYDTLMKMRANDVVETILDVFIDDGLVAGNNNKIFEKIEYVGETQTVLINTRFSEFQKKFKPDRIILDLADEALLMGEYMLPIEGVQGLGITKILDNADLSNIVCVYEGQEKKYFLKKDGREIQKLDKDSHIHFVMNHKKLKVQVKDFQPSTYKNDTDNDYILPKYIKVGRSVIFPVINKIKQLQTLEMANLASDLREILKPTIIQVGMPEKTPPEKIGDIIERYETIFSNIFSGLHNAEELNFADLLSVITTIKVLPAPSDGRGGFVKPDLVNASQSENKEQAIRKAIALTVGIPYYYLSLSDNPVHKLEGLKLFSRYARKLNSMQDNIIEGIKELLCLHVRYAEGLIISPDDVHISMREIVNIELLDRMEYLIALMAGLEEVIKLVSIVEENNYINIGVDSNILLEILNKNLGEFQGYKDLFVYKDKTSKRQNSVEKTNGSLSDSKEILNRFENAVKKFNKEN